MIAASHQLNLDGQAEVACPNCGAMCVVKEAGTQATRWEPRRTWHQATCNACTFLGLSWVLETEAK